VAVRNERRDANRHIDQLVKDKTSHVSEDNAKDAKDDVEKLTKQNIEKVDETCNKKVAEIESDLKADDPGAPRLRHRQRRTRHRRR
ncbi:MAG: ribosome recycling factor, partial [Planctomycetota bacterium]|jgi:ribosome recycling factor